MKKLTSTARALNGIARVVSRICIGFGIACAVLLLIAIFLPGHLYHYLVSTADMTLELGNVQLQLSQALEPTHHLRLFVCVTLASAAVMLALAAACFRLLRRVFTPMAAAKPFDAAVSGSLRKLAWLSLAIFAVESVLGFAAGQLQLQIYDLSRIFVPELVEKVTVTHTFEASWLLLPASLFLLSYVFRYGEELQRQSDETL